MQFKSLFIAKGSNFGAACCIYFCIIRFFILRQRSFIDNLDSYFYHHVTKPGQIQFLKLQPKDGGPDD